MIKLNRKTQQDFLNREWVQKLLNVGVDMSDAKYKIVEDSWCRKEDMMYFVTSKEQPSLQQYSDVCPTYTISELMYKLHEWIYPTIDGKSYNGGLKFYKDAPFYVAYYELKHEVVAEDGKVIDIIKNEEYIHAECEYPIETFASLLIQCHKKDIGIPMKDTGNISNK